MTQRRTSVRCSASSSARAVPVHRAEDALRERDPVERVGVDRQVDLDGRAGRDVLEPARPSPTTSAGGLERPVERLVTVPLSWPSTSRRSAVTSGPVALRLGADRPDRAEPDRRGRGRATGRPGARRGRRAVPPPKTSPFIGAARSASPGDRAPGRWRAIGLNTPRYDWVVPPVGARRAADDARPRGRSRPSRAAARRCRTTPTVNTTISAGTVTHAHSRRSSRLQDEVVDGPDEDDVAEQEHEQARRSAAARGSAGSTTAATIWRVVRERHGRRAARAGRSRRHSGVSQRRRPRRSRTVVGSKPSRVTEPLPSWRSAAITRSPEVASARPAPGSPA